MNEQAIRPIGVPLATGQNRCYDVSGQEIPCVGSGQDGESRFGRPWPDNRFQVNEETVGDRLTGLVWCRNANINEFPADWEDALARISGMNGAAAFGHRDWRLPNRRELLSLVSYQDKNPALAENHPFTNVFLGWYWTSTTAAINPAYAWYIHLEGGRMFYGRKDQEYLFWPVRGRSEILCATGQRNCYDKTGTGIECCGSGQDGEFRQGIIPPDSRFLASKETVLDQHTGLLWMRDANFFGQPLSWKQAMLNMELLNRENVAGRSDWHLPSINALESLVDCSRHSPALPAEHPFARVQEVYWSATTSFFETGWAWALYLNKGALGVGYKQTTSFAVWPVCYPGPSSEPAKKNY